MKKGRKAWLVEWQSPNGQEPENPIAAIFRPQMGGETVRQHVELIYSTNQYCATEMLRFMVASAENPYKAVFGSLPRRDDGSGQMRVTWSGQITCGHNPFLYARLVDNLREGQGTYPDGSPRLEWDEIPHPVIGW
jgi:hypothetical protein